MLKKDKKKLSEQKKHIFQTFKKNEICAITIAVILSIITYKYILNVCITDMIVNYSENYMEQLNNMTNRVYMYCLLVIALTVASVILLESFKIWGYIKRGTFLFEVVQFFEIITFTMLLIVIITIVFAWINAIVYTLIMSLKFGTDMFKSIYNWFEFEPIDEKKYIGDSNCFLYLAVITILAFIEYSIRFYFLLNKGKNIKAPQIMVNIFMFSAVMIADIYSLDLQNKVLLTIKNSVAAYLVINVVLNIVYDTILKKKKDKLIKLLLSYKFEIKIIENTLLNDINYKNNIVDRVQFNNDIEELENYRDSNTRDIYIELKDITEYHYNKEQLLNKLIRLCYLIDKKIYL